MSMSMVIIFGFIVLAIVLTGVWLSKRETDKMDASPEDYRRDEENERLNDEVETKNTPPA